MLRSQNFSFLMLQKIKKTFLPLQKKTPGKQTFITHSPVCQLKRPSPTITVHSRNEIERAQKHN
jgi:hypothetical protein